jgi:metal-responsive CopG/Arc/MetJ family transcriptional regulator
VALTVRLSPKAERTLNALVKRTRLSRSEVVREALAQYVADDRSDAGERGPYAAWADVVGIVELGARHPEQTTGEQFAAIVREGTRARRSR